MLHGCSSLGSSSSVPNAGLGGRIPYERAEPWHDAPAMDAEVLIVGAGPTGLMLANQLVRHGVSARIIDRHDGPAQQTRALGVQARTLEIYQQLGIADEAIALGRNRIGARCDVFNAELPVRIALDDIAGGFFVLRS